MDDPIGFYAGRSIAEPMSPEEEEAAIRDFRAMLAKRGAVEERPTVSPTHLERFKTLLDEMRIPHFINFGDDVEPTDIWINAPKNRYETCLGHLKAVFSFNPDGSILDCEYVTDENVA